jgi:WD40 repeat protein
MLVYQLPTDFIEYLQLAFPATGMGLVVSWGTQTTPWTVAVFDEPGTPPTWELTARPLCLSPDGEWVSVYDKETGKVRINRIGVKGRATVVDRSKGADNVWTAVAPGGGAVAWKDGQHTVVRTVPGGEPVARVKSGWGYDLRFSPGGRWLTEIGDSVFRVYDRAANYRVFARIRAPRFMLAGVTDGLTAVVNGKDAVAVWDLSTKSVTASLQVGERLSALAISADGRRVLTGTLDGEVTLWDAAGTRLQQYDWGVKAPIAAAFAPDGLRAAVGGSDRRVVVWDLDD